MAGDSSKESTVTHPAAANIEQEAKLAGSDVLPAHGITIDLDPPRGTLILLQDKTQVPIHSENRESIIQMRTGLAAFKDQIKQKYLMNEHRMKEIEELLETGHNMEAAVTYYEEVTKSRHRQKDDELLHGSGMENFEAWTSADINKAVKKGQGLIKQMHQENEWTTQRLLLKAGKMRDVHRELRKRALESDKVALDANAGTKRQCMSRHQTGV